mgnify:CR=1 FL=1
MRANIKSAFVILKHPVDLLGALMNHICARLLVVWWVLLLRGWWQHRNDAHTHATCFEGWGPIRAQGAQADVAAGVHMFVHWRSTDKHHLWWVERILICKPKLKGKLFALVKATVSALKVNMPYVFLCIFDQELKHMGIIIFDIFFFPA